MEQTSTAEHAQKGLSLSATRERKLLWGTETWLVEEPLLVKCIAPEQNLSVQVHPGEASVGRTGGRPKTEAWGVVHDGTIYAGFREGVTRGQVAAAANSAALVDLLVRHEARAGEIYFIPAGLVHALGAGVSVFEVQQPSDTTFRLYDWDRTGPDGRPRELQIAEALEAIDLSLGAPVAASHIDNQFFSLCVAEEGSPFQAVSQCFSFGIASKSFAAHPAGDEFVLAERSFVAMAK
jgi:mannose-6-phosphate isomerase class I